MNSHDASHDSLHAYVLQHLPTAVIDLSLGTRVRDIMIGTCTTAVQGRRARKGDLVTRITVTLSIFIFSTWFSRRL